MMQPTATAAAKEAWQPNRLRLLPVRLRAARLVNLVCGLLAASATTVAAYDSADVQFWRTLQQTVSLEQNEVPVRATLNRLGDAYGIGVFSRSTD